MKKAWCPTCQTFTAYKVDREWRDVEFYGVKTRYRSRTATCRQCGNVLYIPDITWQNVTARIEALHGEAKREEK